MKASDAFEHVVRKVIEQTEDLQDRRRDLAAEQDAVARTLSRVESVLASLASVTHERDQLKQRVARYEAGEKHLRVLYDTGQDLLRRLRGRSRGAPLSKQEAAERADELHRALAAACDWCDQIPF